jgi:hypothetical protein
MPDEKKLDADKIKEKVVEQLRNNYEKVRDSIFDVVASVIPKDVGDHISASKKELLLALRSLIDEEIKRGDENLDKFHQAKEKK